MAKSDKRRARQLAARKDKIRKQKAQNRSRSADSRPGPVVTVTRENIAEAMTTAVALHSADKFSAAGRIYRQVLAIAPDHPDALSSLAMIEFQARNYDQATTLLEQVIATRGDNPGYHMNLGAVFAAAGNSAEAITCYQRAIELAPTYPDPYYNLGDLHLLTGHPDA
ncbi:MAG: tetratricopeptide repeat protein, partial [Pseudomonadales bacterium]